MVKKIVIVGGGSAGWITAAHLCTRLENVEITLIESSDIPIVGVGESTIVPMVNFMRSLGLEESDWMRECDATYKSAIRFKNFHNTEDPAFWYPFEPMNVVANRPLNRFWHNKHLTDPDYNDRFSFYDYCFVTPEFCRNNKTLRSITEAGPAYHLDAGKLGEFLMKYSTKKGVTRVIDTIRGVKLTREGTIRSLKRDGGPELEGDLFIDCTGFRSLLLGKTLEEPFDYYYDYLFNNKAVALRYPYQDPDEEMFSYTNCTAISSGWVWQIPLYERMGSGYVYCDRHKSQDDAELELKQFLGFDRLKDLEARHIDIRVGKHQRTWVKNCIGIGLSSGFIEPLESTGLFIAQHQAETLGHILADGRCDYNAGDVKVYNDTQTELYERIRDFLICHYALTNREDTPYWREVKYETRIPDSLADILRLSRMQIPDAPVVAQFHPANFGDHSFTGGWQSILIGMNYMPADLDQFRFATGPFEDQIVRNMGQADKRTQEMQQFRNTQVPELPSHYEYLRSMYGEQQ
jgi:tryptophan halogenase